MRRNVIRNVIHTNDNFWQAISVFMFQGECTVNLNNLFSKPSTPILTWTNPRQSFLGNYDYASHFTYDNSSVSVRFHFHDLHLPSSASVWSVLFGFSQWRINNGAIGARAPGPRAPGGPQILNKQNL